jgi:hypothetical protein
MSNIAELALAAYSGCVLCVYQGGALWASPVVPTPGHHW